MADRSSSSMNDAAKVMRWYRDFQTRAPEDFYIFLGLQTVPSAATPSRRDHWGKKMCVLLVAHNGPEGRRSGGQRGPRGASEADHRLGGPDPIPGAAGHVRRRSIQRACSGTGRATSSRRCPTPPSTPILSMLRRCPAKSPACIFIRSMGRSIARRRMKRAWNCRDATWSMVIAGDRS